jgi:hypothetical protein
MPAVPTERKDPDLTNTTHSGYSDPTSATYLNRSHSCTAHFYGADGAHVSMGITDLNAQLSNRQCLIQIGIQGFT